MTSLHQQEPRRWGSLIDMPVATAHQASAILRRKVPANVVFILPYRSTESGEYRVWRCGPDTEPARRRKPLFDEPGGVA